MILSTELANTKVFYSAWSLISSYPLSIVLVGVGDGPWEDMQKFDDKLPARAFDNFQVNIRRQH